MQGSVLLHAITGTLLVTVKNTCHAQTRANISIVNNSKLKKGKRRTGFFREMLRTNLGDNILSEMRVSGHCMWDTHREKINESLHLMYHSICVGHLASVRHAGASASANHTVNLFMNFHCHQMNKVNNKAKEQDSHNFAPILSHSQKYTRLSRYIFITCYIPNM